MAHGLPAALRLASNALLPRSAPTLKLRVLYFVDRGYVHAVNHMTMSRPPCRYLLGPSSLSALLLSLAPMTFYKMWPVHEVKNINFLAS